MKRPPSLQLFDAREEGKGPGLNYYQAPQPLRTVADLNAATQDAPAPPIVEPVPTAANTVAPKVIV